MSLIDPTAEISHRTGKNLTLDINSQPHHNRLLLIHQSLPFDAFLLKNAVRGMENLIKLVFAGRKEEKKKKSETTKKKQKKKQKKKFPAVSSTLSHTNRNGHNKKLPAWAGKNPPRTKYVH